MCLLWSQDSACFWAIRYVGKDEQKKVPADVAGTLLPTILRIKIHWQWGTSLASNFLLSTADHDASTHSQAK